MQHHFSPQLQVIKTHCEAGEHDLLVHFLLVGAASEISLQGCPEEVPASPQEEIWCQDTTRASSLLQACLRQLRPFG